MDNPHSRRTALNYANDAGVEYSYDTASPSLRAERGNPVLSLDNSTGSGHYVYEYAYDKVGNRTSMAVTDSGGTKMHLYAYDNIYQVTEVNYPVGYEYLATDTTFHYDNVGNRTSVIDTGGTTNYTTNALNQYTAVGGVTCLYDASGNMTCDGANIYEYDPENRLTKVTEGADAFAAACDIDLKFTTGGDAAWFCQSDEYSTDHDAAQSGDIGDNQETWLQTTVTGPGALRFDFKLSCDPSNDGLGLYVDGLAVGFWTAGGVWNDPGPFSITGSGTHTIRWKYIKGGSSSAGSDCLWIDNVRWSGAMPDVNEIEYVYDPSGRRIEKKVDGDTELKFLYDGDHIIAEYDANDTLLRKYVHGPCTDQPICMIESSGTYAGTHYYHYDALGSVVALTDPNGDVVQLYEYSIYGQAAASDSNHPNRFMFTGREFDQDTGLYYYRARYYHPEIGRFLQTDPIGYGDGMNVYAYCRNNSTNCIDPSGLKRGPITVAFYDGSDPGGSTNDGGASVPLTNGLQLKEAADDAFFNISIDMSDMSLWPEGCTTSIQYIISVLKHLKDSGEDVAAVYFFDHGATWGLTMGITGDGEQMGQNDDGSYLTLDGPTSEYPLDLSLLEFARSLGELTNEGTTLNFRNCYAGLFGADIAEASSRVTTGSTNTVSFGHCPEWSETVEWENAYGLPDYDFVYDSLLRFDPSGGEPVPINVENGIWPY